MRNNQTTAVTFIPKFPFAGKCDLISTRYFKSYCICHFLSKRYVIIIGMIVVEKVNERRSHGWGGGVCGLEALHSFRTTVDKCLNPMANAGMGGGGGTCTQYNVQPLQQRQMIRMKNAI